MRQDDNGNQFLINEYTSEEEARKNKEFLEELSHKQIYWVEKTA